MGIPIRSKQEIATMAEAGRVVALALSHAMDVAREGMSLIELDKIIEDKILSHNMLPAFKGLYGFPNSACISVNEVVIHGVPTDYRLKNGDIVGVDVGTKHKGYFSDGAVTFGIGNVSHDDQRLLSCSLDTLNSVISSISVGMRFKELSLLLQENITTRGYVPLLNYCGHGIGTRPHCDPSIPNYLGDGVIVSGPRIKDGMAFCIEPMVCQKSGNPVVLDDKWSVVSEDGLNASHHEHTLVMVGGKARILTEL